MAGGYTNREEYSMDWALSGWAAPIRVAVSNSSPPILPVLHTPPYHNFYRRRIYPNPTYPILSSANWRRILRIGQPRGGKEIGPEIDGQERPLGYPRPVDTQRFPIRQGHFVLCIVVIQVVEFTSWEVSNTRWKGRLGSVGLLG